RAINLRDVCQRIAGQVMDVARAPGQEIHIQVHGPNIRLTADQATPAALMVNELLLNAVEHGVGNRSRGEIEITLQDLGDTVELVVADDRGGPALDFKHLTDASLASHI